ncbi:MAG: hypothetical protein ACI9BH_002327, partial [Paracoccaceae bacterium]
KKGINDGQKELDAEASEEAKDVTPDAVETDKDKV